jgi:Mg2+-importing ATPase
VDRKGAQRRPAARRWWDLPLADLFAALHATPSGLNMRQAGARLRNHGPNRSRPPAGPSLARRVAARLLDPLILVLISASLISAMTGDAVSFAFVAVIVVFSILLDLLQEHRAGRAVEALQNSVALRVRVWRDGRCVELPAERLVPGDCVELSAGNLVPADGRVVEATDFFVNQAAMTGEAYPVEKRAIEAPTASADALGTAQAVFTGSTVVSGSARVLVCATGANTEFGRLAHTLGQEPPPTAFEQGTRRFGLLLTRATMALVLFVLLINTLYHRRPAGMCSSSPG